MTMRDTMNLTHKTGDLLHEATDLAVLLSAEDAPLPAAVADLIEPADFRGKAKQARLIYPRGAVAPRRVLLLGLGNTAKITADTVRQAQELQVAAFAIGFNGAAPLDPALSAQALAEGLELGAYRYHRYRTGLSAEQKFAVTAATVVGDGDSFPAGLAAGQAIARGEAFARDLVNTPGGALPPGGPRRWAVLRPALQAGGDHRAFDAHRGDRDRARPARDRHDGHRSGAGRSAEQSRPVQRRTSLAVAIVG
jgi:leucyl aminopeptidase